MFKTHWFALAICGRNEIENSNSVAGCKPNYCTKLIILGDCNVRGNIV